MMNASKQFLKLALLIDAENFIVGAGKIGLPIDVSVVINKLAGKSKDIRIASRRAYGDIPAAVGILERDLRETMPSGLQSAVRRNLAKNLVQIADTPYLGSKNSADIWLTVDALSIAYSSSDIDRFAILSSDRDYIPLIIKLRELGKEVVGVGISSEVNPLYVKACDAFYCYSELVAGAKVQHWPVVNSGAIEARPIRESYIELLVQAATAVNRDGKPATGTRVVTLMKQLCPGYNPKPAGFRSSKDLARAAEVEGRVRCDCAGMDFLVTLVPSAANDSVGLPVATSLFPSSTTA